MSSERNWRGTWEAQVRIYGRHVRSRTIISAANAIATFHPIRVSGSLSLSLSAPRARRRRRLAEAPELPVQERHPDPLPEDDAAEDALEMPELVDKLLHPACPPRMLRPGLHQRRTSLVVPSRGRCREGSRRSKDRRRLLQTTEDVAALEGPDFRCGVDESVCDWASEILQEKREEKGVEEVEEEEESVDEPLQHPRWRRRQALSCRWRKSGEFCPELRP